jgi:hypothetical protein
MSNWDNKVDCEDLFIGEPLPRIKAQRLDKNVTFIAEGAWKLTLFLVF